MSHLTEVASIISAFGVIGTLILGVVSVIQTKKNQLQAQIYNLKLIDFEKRRDALVSIISEYISLLDAHSLSYMALTDEEYAGKDIQISSHYYKLETIFYKIKLNLNSDNSEYSTFLSALEVSLKTAETIRLKTTLSEMIASGLRTPDKFADSYIQCSNDKTLNHSHVFEEANELRNSHLQELLIAIEKLQKGKNDVIDQARKYLISEKRMVIGK